MKRAIAVSVGVALLAGCQPIPKTGNPVVTTTQPAINNAGDQPLSTGVSEIITAPTLVVRPTVKAAGTGTGASPTTQQAVRAAPPPTPDMAPPTFSLDSLKRVETTVSTAPLLRLLAMKLNGIPYSRFAGYGAIDFTPNLPEGANPDAITNDILAREPDGPAEAIARVASGQADMAFVCRRPSNEEVEGAKSKGVILRSDLIATEALVFTVNIANPVSELSRAQLKAIFMGESKIWSDLKVASVSSTHEIGGKPITVAYRAQGLGTEELMSLLLLEGQRLPELPVSQALASNKLVLDASNEDKETIGFSVFCYASNMQRDGRIKVLAVDGVLPEPGRVASSEYPLSTPIYIVARNNLESSSNLYALREWLRSMSGQKSLAEAGYMPIVAEAWTQQRLVESGK